jgi:hypothetical protein
MQKVQECVRLHERRKLRGVKEWLSSLVFPSPLSAACPNLTSLSSLAFVYSVHPRTICQIPRYLDLPSLSRCSSIRVLGYLPASPSDYIVEIPATTVERGSSFACLSALCLKDAVPCLVVFPK